MRISTRDLLSLLVVCAVLVAVAGCARTSKKPIAEPGYSVHVEKAPPGHMPPLDIEDIETGNIEELPDRPEGVDFRKPITEQPDAQEYGVIDRIHFDFDKSDVKAEFIEGLRHNAQWMKDHPEYQMLIEGHCDERGTNEYNLALGERRAMAARDFLIQEGVAADRVHTKSWGEEKPIAFGHDEASWYQNRRAEFLVGQSNP